MKVCLAGEGAQGMTYMQALQAVDGVEVAALAGGLEADTAAFAEQWNIPFWSLAHDCPVTAVCFWKERSASAWSRTRGATRGRHARSFDDYEPVNCIYTISFLRLTSFDGRMKTALVRSVPGLTICSGITVVMLSI